MNDPTRSLLFLLAIMPMTLAGCDLDSGDDGLENIVGEGDADAGDAEDGQPNDDGSDGSCPEGLVPTDDGGCPESGDGDGDGDGCPEGLVPGSDGECPDGSGDGDGDSGESGESGESGDGDCPENNGLVPSGDGDCPGGDEGPSEACVSYGELVAMCDPLFTADEAAASCQQSLDDYNSVDPLCGATFESLMACLSPLSCEEYDGPTPPECEQYVEGMNSHCDTPGDS